MGAKYSINCNGCGRGYSWEHYFGAISLGSARRQLRGEGWHAIRVPTESGRFSITRDICPDCWEAGVR